VPETFGTCHGGEVQMEEGMLSAPLPNRASAGSYLTCALGQGDQPERFDDPARDHEPPATPASDVRDAVRLWALMAGGVVTSQELQRPVDTDAWELGIVSTSPWAAVAPALAMAELPPERVRAELAPVWHRLRAGTLTVAELPGQPT
jgi:hypothetical protein